MPIQNLSPVRLIIPPSMQAFWKGQKERGEKRSVMFMCQHQQKSMQPPGYPQAWSVSKKACESMTKTYLADWPSAKVKIIEVQPTL
jgi:hypothetical protein